MFTEKVGNEKIDEIKEKMIQALIIDNLKLLKEMIEEAGKLEADDQGKLEKEVNYCKLKVEAIELTEKNNA